MAVALLKEAVPSVSRIAVLTNPSNASHAPALGAAQIRARSLSLELRPHKVRSSRDLGSAFAAIDREYADAILVLADPVLLSQLHRIAGFAALRSLPTAGDFVKLATAGGLLGFSAGPPEALVLNVKTAKAMRIMVPQSVLQRASRVIE